MNMKLPIYLDYQATTPTDPRVVDEILPYFTEKFGNPHSKNHSFGWQAEEAVEIARDEVAKVIHALPKEIIFTSGATESNNLAIKGVARFYKAKKNHIITVQTEHKCVLESCKTLEKEGFEVTYLPVKENGLIDLDTLKNAITDKTVLVSIMAVHNEIGVIQPIKEIGAICKENNVFFHTDAAQAFGKIPLDVNEMNIDLLSISGHKIYAPKGIGALYVRKKPKVRITPLIDGGRQEQKIRAGTLPTPLVVGLGKASKIAVEEMKMETSRVQKLADYFINEVGKIPHVYLNGDKKQRIAGNVNFTFAFIEGESLMMEIRNIAVSSGSACTSDNLKPSYVLDAIGVREDLISSSIRFSIGRFTTMEEIEYTVELIEKAVDKLRNMSPLWEMVQKGIDIKTVQWEAH